MDINFTLSDLRNFDQTTNIFETDKHTVNPYLAVTCTIRYPEFGNKF